MLPETRTTVAILGGNPLVGRALELLLESAGYKVRLLEEPEAFEDPDLLAGVDVLLLGRFLLPRPYRFGVSSAVCFLGELESPEVAL